MSPQQKKIMDVLSDGLKHSTKELTERTNIGYPPRRIHELRKKGIKIESEPGEHWEIYWLETPACASAQVESYKVPQSEEKPVISQNIAKKQAYTNGQLFNINTYGK